MRAPLAVIGDECGFTWPDQIANAAALDLQGIEIRSVAGRSLGEHSRREVEAMARSLDGTGLAVVALDSPVGSTAIGDTTTAEDLATTERWLEYACLLGAPSVRVMSYGPGDSAEPAWRAEVTRRLLALRDLAGRYGRRLVHENCAGWGGRSPESARQLMQDVGGEHLGFLLDTGNGVWYGYDSVAMAEAVLPYIRHLHVKDAYTQEGVAVPCLPGQGRGRVADTLALVLATYPDLTVSLEPHLLVQPHLGIRCDDSAALGKSVAECRDALTRLAGEVLP